MLLRRLSSFKMQCGVVCVAFYFSMFEFVGQQSVITDLGIFPWVSFRRHLIQIQNQIHNQSSRVWDFDVGHSLHLDLGLEFMLCFTNGIGLTQHFQNHSWQQTFFILRVFSSRVLFCFSFLLSIFWRHFIYIHGLTHNCCRVFWNSCPITELGTCFQFKTAIFLLGIRWVGF